MGEFNKDQGQQDQGGQQGGKPAFDQFDKEQGQQDQQDFNQKGEEIDREGQQEQGQDFEKAGQGDDPSINEKGQGEGQNR